MRKLNDLCNRVNLNEIFFIVGKKQHMANLMSLKGDI